MYKLLETVHYDVSEDRLPPLRYFDKTEAEVMSVSIAAIASQKACMGAAWPFRVRVG